MPNPSQPEMAIPAGGQADAKAQAMLLVLNEQIAAAASKVRLLAEMGLTRTSGYREAVETYECKVKAYDDLKARLQGA